MPTGQNRGGTGSDRARCEVCGKQLSAYNTGATCYSHTVAIPWRSPTSPQR